MQCGWNVRSCSTGILSIPVVELPVVELPVVELPAVELPAEELPAVVERLGFLLYFLRVRH